MPEITKWFQQDAIYYPLGNHTVGIISGSEKYNVIKISCKELFNDINEVIAQGKIVVDDHVIPLEFFLSGDYKVRNWTT